MGKILKVAVGVALGIMLEKEFQKIRKHPDFLKHWKKRVYIQS